MKNRLHLVLSVLAAVLAFAAGTPAAHAEFPAARERAARPSGWFLGLGVGGGDLSCEGPSCDQTFDEAGSMSAHLGRRVSPNLGLVADLWFMGHTEDRFTVTQGIFTVGVRWWVLPRLWIQGGVGGARASWHYDGGIVQLEDRSDTVPGASLAIGLDVLSTVGGGFAMDAQLRVGTGTYDDEQSATNAAFQLGFTWQ